MNVATLLVDQFARWELGHLFGVSGANIELLFDAAARHDAVQPVLAKHEAAAAMMAIGYADRADRLGVVLTTSGGGAFNISAPLTEALESGVPIVALVGQSPVGRDGTGAFQDSSGRATRVDAERIFAPLSVHCIRVGAAEDALGAVQQAASAALVRQGPAVVLLPRDVQAAEPGEPRFASLPRAQSTTPVSLAPSVVTALARALGGPVAPLIIAGRGVVTAGGASALRQLARSWGCPIAVTPDAKSAIDSRSSYALGVCGVMGHPEVLDYAHRAPLSLLVGTPLPDVASFGLAEALATTPIINVGERLCFPGLAGHSEVIDVLGDVEATLTAFLEQVPAPSVTWDVPAACAIRARRGDRTPAPIEPRALGSVATMERLAAAIEPGSDVFVDAGNAGAFAVHHLPADGIGSFSVALGMGAMGHAFGAAIGAAVHSRRFRVGDIWGLFYAGHEIELRNLKTILEHRHAGRSCAA